MEEIIDHDGVCLQVEQDEVTKTVKIRILEPRTGCGKTLYFNDKQQIKNLIKILSKLELE